MGDLLTDDAGVMPGVGDVVGESDSPDDDQHPERELDDDHEEVKGIVGVAHVNPFLQRHAA
jgi:hypothetical protein